MNKYLMLILSIALFLASCGGNENKRSNEENEETDQIEQGLTTEQAKDCDEFVDQYEKWMDDYLILIEKYMENPMDAAISQEYATVAADAANWYSQWNNKVYCAANPKYQERFEEIADRADKKMKELGLE